MAPTIAESEADGIASSANQLSECALLIDSTRKSESVFEYINKCVIWSPKMILNLADDDGCESVKGFSEHPSSMSETVSRGTKRMTPDKSCEKSAKCSPKLTPGNSPTSEKCMRSSTGMEVNGTDLDPLPPTLNAHDSNFVYNDDASPVPLTIDQSIITPSVPGECNGTKSDAFPLTSNRHSSDFLYNDNDSPAPLTTDASIITLKCASQNKSVPGEPNGTESDAFPLTSHGLNSDFVYNDDDSPVPLTIDKSIITAKNAYRSVLQERVELRRSPRLSSTALSLGSQATKTKSRLTKLHVSGHNMALQVCSETRITPNKKQRKLKRAPFFVGDPLPEDEAQEKWGWRYELKGQNRKRKSSIQNAGDDDEVHLDVVCHYIQANVDGYIYNLGDCAHIKGEGKQKHVGRIVEFFKTSDDKNYFRVQWFFRAEETVLKEAAAILGKKRLFASTLMNDNLLDCILSKVKVVEKDPRLDLKLTSIQPSDYYCDMEYSVKYSTFRSLVTDSLVASSLDANNMDITTTPLRLVGCDKHKSELALLDLYAGCGGMSTGLCLGAKLSGVKLVTKWAIDYQKSACDSLQQNHPETQVRHITAVDFLQLLKEWEKLCKKYVFSDPNKEISNESFVEDDGVVAPGEYEVSSLVDICYGDPSSTGQEGLKFKVRWKGYDPSEDTWELIEDLSDCQGHIQDFIRHGYQSKILPLPGDVDVICGGPPCQGISGYNRFRKTDNPLTDERNQQIVVFYDIVKFLKPKYVLMENVADILRFDKASLGRYALSRLVHMNYQSRLGIMAAGSYGLPQFRLRVFIWGALPTERLPQFPLPTHEVIVRYFPPAEFEQHTVAYDEGQPRQLQEAVVLRDAISDLPPVTSHEEREEIAYEKPPETEFQKYIRLTKDELNGSAVKGDTESVLTDHRTYKLSEDDFHRVCHVPRRKGANFRDFPGLIVTCDNLVKHDPKMKQVLLPSGKRLVPDYVFTFEKGRSKRPFARLWWDENVPTVLTFPNLHSQAVIHPEQDRVLTVREYARLQGFPDHYRFCGNVKERYCQVGNAVAVSVSKTLGYSLGMAFRKLSGDEALMTLPPAFAYQSCKWRVIAKIKEDLRDMGINLDDMMVRKLGNGQTTFFWKDNWLGEELLKCLETDAAVIWDWKMPLRRGRERAAVQQLGNQLSDIVLTDKDDAWCWTGCADGCFSVRSLRSVLVDRLRVNINSPFKWIAWVPKKVNCFAWRIMLNRIPTKDNLLKRGVNVGSILCTVCEQSHEEVDHLLFACKFAKEIWAWLIRWSGFGLPMPANFGDLCNYGETMKTEKWKRKLFWALTYGAMWSIWGARNDLVFKNKRLTPMRTADDIQLNTFNWIKHRTNRSSLNWHDCPSKKELSAAQASDYGFGIFLLLKHSNRNLQKILNLQAAMKREVIKPPSCTEASEKENC
ncbi:hypothetical protein LXL04_029180 [Taraxacum kok-saghyz]